MPVRQWKPLLLAAIACAATAMPAATPALNAYANPRPEMLSVVGAGLSRLVGVAAPQGPRNYQEPAYARGYRDGYEDGSTDGRQRNRYDPVGSRRYRDGDEGYSEAYGSREAYRNNYRAGFRQGYDDGYRDGTK